ncbi:Hypothetical predicted protein [Cloeon dipterum]|uniref:Phosphatidic acid phosphatase type 2/haloperoxidase domain-containing protein n=1 Tax=Cloeon dipterum TaxID=197152 RepID=A0A8S1DUJ9_9INSE|nr:Hypothetical predicted protein [Cloeon dipterum]
MDKEVRALLRRVLLDGLALAAVGISLLVFKLWGQPYQRGFFCNDESLQHPFHYSTVTSEMLYFTGFFIPIAIFLGTEVRRKRQGCRAVGARPLPLWMWETYRVVGVFLFGAACSQLTTDIGKYTIGRLRPHFLQLCKPNIDCSLAENMHVYHEAFECTNAFVDAYTLKEVRLSFPSGHSSFSAYTMVFLVIYVQVRWTRHRIFTLLRPFVQFLALSLAWFTALTRVSNYKHHWSDVLVGSLQGSIVAILIARWVCGLKKGSTDRDSDGSLPMVRPGTNSTVE